MLYFCCSDVVTINKSQVLEEASRCIQLINYSSQQSFDLEFGRIIGLMGLVLSYSVTSCHIFGLHNSGYRITTRNKTCREKIEDYLLFLTPAGKTRFPIFA